MLLLILVRFRASALSPARWHTLRLKELCIPGPGRQQLAGVNGIRVNAILPAMATPMYEEAMSKLSEEATTAAFWMNHQSIALGNKYGDPLTDLGPVMVFFASDASRFITGQLIPVDGGQTNTR